MHRPSPPWYTWVGELTSQSPPGKDITSYGEDKTLLTKYVLGSFLRWRDMCKFSTRDTDCLSIFQFHQFSGMNFRAQFQISWVGASLFSGGTVYVYVSMALYPELGICLCRIIDSQPVPLFSLAGCHGYWNQWWCFGCRPATMLLTHSKFLWASFICWGLQYQVYCTRWVCCRLLLYAKNRDGVCGYSSTMFNRSWWKFLANWRNFASAFSYRLNNRPELGSFRPYGSATVN